MEAYMDERWKLSKKGSRNSNSSSSSRSTSSSLDSGGSLPRRSSSTPKARKTNSQRSFTNRCASLVKEQRAKFYIMRRCVTMLICWSD